MSRADLRRAMHRVASTAIVTLLLLELGARVATGSLFTWGATEDRGRYGIVDPRVGHIPRSGLSATLPTGITITTGEHGTRVHRRTARSDRPLTLVVGDSFAFGDEVSDDDTWPARLEQRTGRRVVNAAVPGFGLDQAVLRAEQLAPLLSPDVVVVSFIPHDVLRCEMSIWSGNAKPYFDLDGAELVYHPAPETSHARMLMATPLSYSVLIDSLFHDALQRDGEDTLVHRRGIEVACALVRRVASLRRPPPGRERGATVVLLAQPQTPLPGDARYPEHPPRRDPSEIVSRVLACARAEGLATLDLLPVVAALPTAQRARLFHGNGHNSPEGNQLVADHVADLLRSLEPR